MSSEMRLSLKHKGGRWYHTSDHSGPDGAALSMTKKRLGEFFYYVLFAGGEIGDVWAFSHKHHGTLVKVSVALTPEMKTTVEQATGIRLEDPPKVHLASTSPEPTP